jgi:signal transduction histidine kinase
MFAAAEAGKLPGHTHRSRGLLVLRYGCAVVSVAAALGATKLLGAERVGESSLFFAAVALSAWYGGLGPGLLATVLAGGCTAFFLIEPVSSARVGWDDAVRVLVFLLVAVSISYLQEASRRANARMVEAKNEAVAANRAKDRFLAVLSHELRNPLNPILTVSGLLESDPRLPDDARDDLRMVRRNAELEARLVDDLLDVNRISRGKLAIAPEAVDAHELVREVLRMCGPDAEAKGVALMSRLAADRHRLHADPGRMRQVLWNLLRNAIKFTPADGRVTVTSSTTSDGGLRLDVSDTGIGIPPEALGRIFQAFEQGDETVARRYGGLGLGLAISRSLIESHGGSLDASSPGPGHGATFTIRLPTVDAAAHYDAAPRPRHGAPERSPSRPNLERAPAAVPATVTSRGLRILLLEDHADTARAMTVLLRGDGHHVTSAGTVADALRASTESQFDVVISDLRLPDGSGVEVMRRLRGQGVRTIALSGYGPSEGPGASPDAGYDEYLTKPVSAQTLEAAIQRVTSAR